MKSYLVTYFLMTYFLVTYFLVTYFRKNKQKKRRRYRSLFQLVFDDSFQNLCIYRLAVSWLCLITICADLLL